MLQYKSATRRKPCAAILGTASALLLSTHVLTAATKSPELYNDGGYRSDRYRAPLPESVIGGTTISPQDLQQLVSKNDPPVLIDVQAITLRKEAIEFGISWLPNSDRLNIPGSTWLPNVGYGELEPFMEAFFRDNLQRLSKDKKDSEIVFYCIADCWMSWNAVRRAAEWGYSNLYWLPAGTDGWIAAGGDVVKSVPEPIIKYLEALQTTE